MGEEKPRSSKSRTDTLLGAQGRTDEAEGGNDRLKISDFLQEGEENATASRTIESITGLSGEQVRSLVHAERLKGVPIISTRRGYFMAANEMEKIQFIRSMRHRAKEIQRAADAVERGEQSTDNEDRG